MKKTGQTTTTSYDTIECKGYSFDFKKNVKSDGFNVMATPRIDGKQAGYVSYNSADGTMSLQLRISDTSILPDLLAQIGKAVNEIIIDK